MKKNKKQIGIVYLVKCKITLELYIGATTKSLAERKKDHLQKARNNTGHYFHEAISTYGSDAFLWEQIDSAETINELAHKEKQYIAKFKTNTKGYNGSIGGEFKKRVYQYDMNSGLLLVKFNSLKEAADNVGATKKQISRACLNVNKTFKGFRWSYDLIEMYSVVLDKRMKAVLQFDSNKELVASYSSVSKASKATGCNKTSIAKVCRGERTQAGGFVWRYK